MLGVEAAGHGLDKEHAASLAGGFPGVLHGNKTYLLQNEDGQIDEGHSISAGLDYPGIGPEHAWLRDIGRVEYTSATDVEAVTPVLQDLMGRYDAAVAAILADPRVASDPISVEVEAYLALFTDNSTFADGALANWAREGEQGRFYRPGSGGQLTRSTVITVTPADDDEATFTICAENSMEITDSEGNVVESSSGMPASTTG
jgi:hypothetical protein